MADWRITGFFSERVEADADERRDDENPVFRSITDVGLTFRRATPRASITLSPGVNAIAASNQPLDLSRVNPSFAGAARIRGRRQTLSASASLVPRVTDFDQFEDTELVEGEAVQLSLNGNVNWSYSIDPRTSFSLGAFARAREYDENASDLVPTRSFGASAALSRDLDRRTSVSLSFRAADQSADNEEETESRIYALTAGVNRRISPRFTFDASLGPSLIDSSRLENGAREDDLSLGVIGDASLGYAATPATTAAFTVSQTVDQNVLGDLENRSAVGLSLSHQINSRSSAGLSMQAGFQNPLVSGAETEQRLSFSVAPGYSLALTSEWSANLGYEFEIRDEERQGVSTSHTGFVRVSRDFTLAP